MRKNQTVPNKEVIMTSIVNSPVNIQTSAQSVPSIPAWFREITLLIHHLQRQGVLAAIEEQVRFARRLLTTVRGHRFCCCALRLCDQRRTDVGSLLRVPPALGRCVHGALWARSLAGACNAQPFSRRAGSGHSRVP